MPFDAVIELSALAGTNGFRISGVGSDQGAWSVSTAGDVNGDGIDDLIIGTPYGGDSGASYVVFGRQSGFPDDLNLSTLNGRNGFRIIGESEGDKSGWSVASAGDVNGDGFDDLIIGAPYAGGPYSSHGASYVVFGTDVAFEPNFSLAGLTGANGFRISPAHQGERNGISVDTAGDFNGDGIADLLIGAPGAPSFHGNYAGASYVVFGKLAGFSATLQLDVLHYSGFRIDGPTAFDSSGRNVAEAGDFNGDGFDDVIIGSVSGAYVVFGGQFNYPWALDLSTVNGTNGFRISGATFNSYSRTLESAGDVNGDGFDDLIIGDPSAGPNGYVSGLTYVVFGSAANLGNNLDLSTLNGSNGFQISGAAPYETSGRSVDSAGDVNGDGYDDLIIGVPGATQYGGVTTGASYVVFGSGAGFAQNINLSDLDGTNGFRINGVAESDSAGLSVAAAGDINGDGIDDLIVGAPYADTNGNYSGASYVIFGRASAVVEAGTAADDNHTGGAAGDQLSGQDGEDVLSGLGGDDALNGGEGDDALYGGAGADDLVGGAGGDLLDGGAGADVMAGGSGDDTYIVDDLGDVTTELGGEGSDRVRATVSFTLAANIENLTLEGAGDIDGTGNGLNNVLDGNSGANTLSGGGGNDLIKGGAGDDVLNGGTGADQLLGGIGEDDLDGADDNDRLEGGDGNDTILGGTGNDILDGGADNDTLNGGTGADQLLGGGGTDTLDGGDGNDSLNGGTGADAMTGGLGDDIFFVDDAGDTTIEAAGEGIDQVRASISHTLADNIETLTLQGVADLNGSGNGLANTLNGNSGDNVLDGAGGNDLLKGGLGADTLIGGTGNDILAGGGGGDSFVVRQESMVSSLLGGTVEVDTISDFSTLGGDIIDLSAIDAIAGGADDAFQLVGAFNGQAGQMTLTFGGDVTTLRLDVDGDGKADYMVKISGDVTADSSGWLL